MMSPWTCENWQSTKNGPYKKGRYTDSFFKVGPKTWKQENHTVHLEQVFVKMLSYAPLFLFDKGMMPSSSIYHILKTYWKMHKEKLNIFS